MLNKIRNSPFKNLVRKYYLGKIVHGTPYFNPRGFLGTIISIRRLKLRTTKELKEHNKRHPHQLPCNSNKFSNLPMVRRNKNWILKILDSHYYIEVGFPIRIHKNELGWKDKNDSPRFEWGSALYVFFFKWQFIMWYKPTSQNEDLYWEMFLWWKYYCDKDIEEAEKTWPWVSVRDRKSTWDNGNLK